MRLRGRIDRVDFHPESGERILFDYKTSEKALSPEARHLSGKRWVDLQLPLYRHLAARRGISSPLRLGYILLPRELDKVGKSLASWSESDLLSADAEARKVVRRIRKGDFHKVEEPPPFSEAYAAICQDGLLVPPREEEEEEVMELEE